MLGACAASEREPLLLTDTTALLLIDNTGCYLGGTLPPCPEAESSLGCFAGDRATFSTAPRWSDGQTVWRWRMSPCIQHQESAEKRRQHRDTDVPCRPWTLRLQKATPDGLPPIQSGQR